MRTQNPFSARKGKNVRGYDHEFCGIHGHVPCCRAARPVCGLVTCAARGIFSKAHVLGKNIGIGESGSGDCFVAWRLDPAVQRDGYFRRRLKSRQQGRRLPLNVRRLAPYSQSKYFFCGALPRKKSLLPRKCAALWAVRAARQQKTPHRIPRNSMGCFRTHPLGI